MSKSFASGRQASSSSGVAADEVRARLDEDPALPDAALLQSLRELEAPLRMVPEEIVGDEDAVADRREVVDDGADRPLAEGAPVELPDRAEAAAEGAAARRLDEPDGLEEQAVVAVAVALDEVARRQRDAVEAGALRERAASRPSRRASRRRSAGTSESGRPERERVGERGNDLLAVVHADRRRSRRSRAARDRRPRRARRRG